MKFTRYYLTEDELKTSTPYNRYLELIMTKCSRLSAKVNDNTLFEFSSVDDEYGNTYTLCTTDSRLWSLSYTVYPLDEVIIAFNKEVLNNG